MKPSFYGIGFSKTKLIGRGGNNGYYPSLRLYFSSSAGTRSIYMVSPYLLAISVSLAKSGSPPAAAQTTSPISSKYFSNPAGEIISTILAGCALAFQKV
jgi:hypothetical protein